MQGSGFFNHRAELVLRAIGLILLGISGYRLALYSAFQTHHELFLKLPHASSSAVTFLGKLDIPRLKMSVAVVEGEDEEHLALGAGHLPGTAMPGSSGNIVLAGHRDSAFRQLRSIQIGDQILLHAAKDETYRVTRIRTVEPDDVSVTNSDGTAKLTLITCYPFHYIGPAPRRYIVEARPEQVMSGGRRPKF
jgi:sortase A